MWTRHRQLSAALRPSAVAPQAHRVVLRRRILPTSEEKDEHGPRDAKLTELNASALKSSHRLTASGRPPPTIRARIPTRARAREGEGTRTDGQRSVDVESVCISDDGKLSPARAPHWAPVITTSRLRCRRHAAACGSATAGCVNPCCIVLRTTRSNSNFDGHATRRASFSRPHTATYNAERGQAQENT